MALDSAFDLKNRNSALLQLESSSRGKIMSDTYARQICVKQIYAMPISKWPISVMLTSREHNYTEPRYVGQNRTSKELISVT